MSIDVLRPARLLRRLEPFLVPFVDVRLFSVEFLAYLFILPGNLIFLLLGLL